MYSRQKAVEYAYAWWNKRNPNFFNFDALGGDCTNFISQCLFFGGIEMNFDSLGWFYKNLNSRAPSWTGVDEFFYFSTHNKASTGVKAKVVDISKIVAGDVVQLKLFGEDEFHHSLLVTKVLSYNSINDILVTCHSYDAKDKPLGTYNIDLVRFLKIENDANIVKIQS